MLYRTEPTVEPTEPTVEPTQPTEPTVEPTEPTVEPTEPTVAPTEPTEKPSVSLGDYVWVDKDRNGIQDDDEDPIEGVVLKLIGPDGKEVVDINGNPVGPVTTDENGFYNFKDLPVLKDSQSYTVVIDRDESADALDGYLPTKENGSDRDEDSSTWEAKSEGLNEDGDHDGTLDFGFYLDEVPEPTPSESTPTDPTEEPSEDPTEPTPSESTPTESTENPSEDPTQSPEKSEDPSQDPTPPETSDQPSASQSVDGSEEPKQTQKPKEEDNLADTGFTAMSLLVLGLLLAAAGVVLARRTRGRHS
ncbi:hypothetical protein GCM10007173_06590 [Glutamicibacter ardleyensis]|uniref:SD-repeat containing protein B domain-containing protein n=1 Tax=Glutamicibacter ardleyensis TaxID=225894 RepID=A0ABQ2DDI5_9MICC|nr:hypothetical protein GCM10007173_06590 [Glutamicibacter ardleyensis]